MTSDKCTMLRAKSINDIFVNGAPKTVKARGLDYSEIVRLAFGGSADDKIVYTITFTRGPLGAQGSMPKGMYVMLVDGMIFNVSDTSSA